MAADECNIKVVCRVRPLNAQEEKAGSKFVLKFPTDDTAAVGVSVQLHDHNPDRFRSNVDIDDSSARQIFPHVLVQHFIHICECDLRCTSIHVK